MKILITLLSTLLATGNPAALVTTPGQAATISSLKDVGEGELFTLDYTADYKLQEFIDADLTSQAEVKAAAAKMLLNTAQPVKGETPQPACSAFQAVTPDGDILYGRNFDYNFKKGATIMLRTAPRKAFKSISMVSMNFLGLDADKLTDGKTDLSLLVAAPLTQMDGMNQKGLAISVLCIVTTDCPKQYEPGKHSIMTSVMMRMLLDRAATVDEAIEMLSHYNFFADGLQKGRKKGNFSNYHFFIADATGKYAILEYIKRDGPDSDSPWVLNVVDERQVTNHFRSEGWIHLVKQDERYDRMRRTLEERNGVLTEEEAMQLLNDVHQEAEGKKLGKTQWSVVYNLTKKTATVCVNHDYGKTYRFTLRKKSFK